ncbi:MULTISPECIES: hypothetical protein [unclassified Vibrio]|nr:MULTISPECIES: hypothetical protein [unclassified Vibrio]
MNIKSTENTNDDRYLLVMSSLSRALLGAAGLCVLWLAIKWAIALA